MTSMRQKFAYASVLLLWACTPASDINQPDVTVPGEVVPVADSIAPIRSTQMVIKFQIGDAAPRDWTITPELSPDVLTLECPADEVTNITFTTDLETRTFAMTPEIASPQFDVLVNEDITAFTEIRCIPPIARYTGDFSAERPTANDFEADIGSILATYFADDAPGIILSIAEGDEVLYQKAVGLMDVEAGIPRQVNETFDIASVSKEFTAVSILQLAERNALSLDDPLSKYFSDLPNGDEITLHHLLTHTHGLPQIMSAKTFDGTLPRDLEVSLGHIREQAPRFAPGERYDYGNTPYYLLAVIAQKVSGQDRRTYIRENLLEPAGMTDSFFVYDTPQPAQRTKGYNETDGVIEPRVFDFDPGFAFGTGDIASTLADMHKWQRALSNGTVLSQEMFALATEPKTLNDGREIARGYGFFRGMINGKLAIYNTGDFFTHTRHYYVPDRDLSIILNTNGTPQYDGGQSSIVLMQVLGKVFNTQVLEMFDSSIDLNDL